MLILGCSGAVDRALNKVPGNALISFLLMKGISKVDISLKDQLVKVRTTSASYEEVEAAIRKTGKVIKSGRIVVGSDKVVEAAGTQSSKDTR